MSTLMKNTVTVKIHDEVNASILGLHGDHLKYFYNKYALFAANYFFNPKFKMGRWDGKIAHFSKAGRTFVYLLEDIIPDLYKFGYNVRLLDERDVDYIIPPLIAKDIFSDILHPDTGKPIILRDYQVEAVNALIQDGNGVCLAGTGAGKTITCAATLKAYTPYDIKSITIVPDQTLINQTKSTYDMCNLDVGEYSGKKKDLNHQHVVSTWQALQHSPMLIQQFQLVIIDECHGLRGPILKNIICDYASKIPYRFGFTGTLPKEPIDKLSVHLAVGFVRYEIHAHELIDTGVLAKLNIDCIQLVENLRPQYSDYLHECGNKIKPITYNKFKESYYPDFSAEKSYLQHKKSRLNWVANKLMAERDKKGNVLCLVSSIPVARKLANLIPNAICVNGQDVKEAKNRQKIYDLFETNNDLIVIATVNIAGTGLSINRIFTLFMLDIGKSFTRVIQAVGRSLRTADDKPDVTVIDICSDLKYGTKHLKERIEFYKEAKYPYKKQSVEY